MFPIFCRRRHCGNGDERVFRTNERTGMIGVTMLSMLVVLLLSCISICVVNSYPMVMVTSGRPRCFSAEVPKRTVLKIQYEAPDIDVNTNSKTYSPTYITLLEKPVETHIGGEDTLNVEHQLKERKKKNKPKPVSQEIKDKSGSFLQRIHDDANVEICIRASMANSKNPMRFHIRYVQLSSDDEDIISAGEIEKNAIGADHHWSFLETQMDRIDHEMHTIIAEADFFKERDAIYHQQTDDLHKATLFWPILHVGILLITGFTQANHIVRFFQTRRII